MNKVGHFQIHWWHVLNKKQVHPGEGWVGWMSEKNIVEEDCRLVLVLGQEMRTLSLANEMLHCKEWETL